MRPLRHCYATRRASAPPRPVEPVALLGVSGRPEPAFEARVGLDRAFLGMDVEEASGLGPALPHLLEVAYEALELSGVAFSRLSSHRSAWVHAAPAEEPVALDAAVRLLGLDAPALSIAATGDALLCLALHHATQLLRAGDVDLVLATGRWEQGFAAAVLGRVDRTAQEGWRTRCLVAGSAAGGDDPERVWEDADARAGLGPEVAYPTPSLGTRGVLEAVERLERQGQGALVVDGRIGGQEIRVILSHAEPATLGVGPRPDFLGLSARSASSLRGLARAVVRSGSSDADVVRFAVDAARRPAFEHRAALPVGPWPEVRARLERWLEGEDEALHAGEAAGPGVVLVVPPAGVHRAGSGDALFETEPVFREALRRCDRSARPLLPRALLSVAFPPPGQEPGEVDDPLFAEPLAFAWAWSLAELYRSRGLEPVAVVGAGVGELCAAAIAGAVELEEALAWAVERGRTLGQLRPGANPGGGSPAGPRFPASIGELPFARPELALLSCATGGSLAQADPAHWDATLEPPSRTGEALALGRALGGRIFLELSARPGWAREALAGSGEGRWLGALDPSREELAGLRENLALLWAMGEPVGSVGGARPPGEATLPTYVFDRGDRSEGWGGEPSRDPVPPVEAAPDQPAARPPAVAEPTPGPSGEEPEAEALLEDGTTWVREDSPSDLLDLGRPAAAPPRPMPFLPPETAESLDGSSLGDLTLDGPRRVLLAPPPEPSPTDGLLSTGPEPSSAAWREVPVGPAPAEAVPRTFVLLVDRLGVGDVLATLLEQVGHVTIRVERRRAGDRAGSLHVAEPTVDRSWAAVEAAVASASAVGPVHVVHLWTLDEDEHVPAVAGWPSVATLARVLLASGLRADLHLVTRGAEAEDAPSAALVGAGLRGFASALALETGLLGSVLDLDPDDEDPDLLALHLLDVTGAGAGPAWWKARDGRRWRRTLVTGEEASAPDLATDGVWLVVAELDAGAVELARGLSARGARSLVLVGGGHPPAEVLQAALELQRGGTACAVVRADPNDPRAAELVRPRLAREGALAGVVVRLDSPTAELGALSAAEHLPRWTSGTARVRLAESLVGPEAPVWVWAEGSALCGASGGGVAAAGGAAAELILAGRPGSAVVHSGTRATGSGPLVEPVLALAARGGRWCLGRR